MSDLDPELLVEIITRAYLGSDAETIRDWVDRLNLPEETAGELAREIEKHLVRRTRGGRVLTPIQSYSKLSDDVVDILQRPVRSVRMGRVPKELKAREVEYVVRRRRDKGPASGWETIAEEINAMRGTREMPEKAAYHNMISSGSLRRMDREGAFEKTAQWHGTAESNALEVVETVSVAPNPSLELPPAAVAGLKLLAARSRPIELIDLYLALANQGLLKRFDTVPSQVGQVMFAYAPLRHRGWVERIGESEIQITEAGRQKALDLEAAEATSR